MAAHTTTPSPLSVGANYGNGFLAARNAEVYLLLLQALAMRRSRAGAE
jgi:hypothetical protein